MRDVHVVIQWQGIEPPLNADDLNMQHIPEESVDPNDTHTTQIPVDHADTRVIVHWADGIPDENVRLHVEDAILRSLGL
jgi:hypothetical protein